MGGIWEVDGRYMGGIWEVDGRYMRCRWEVNGRSMEGYKWKDINSKSRLQSISL